MAKPSHSNRTRPDPRGARDNSPGIDAALYLVATPIGNLRDITLRALDVLGAVDLVLAEDTRVARKLLSAHGLSARIERYDDGDPGDVAHRTRAVIEGGGAVALVSDAGTPLLSDPGYRLVEALAGHVRIVPVPGPSALLAALIASGLPTDRFMFAGFAPPRAQARRAWIAALAETQATLVLYETGPRLGECLADLHAVLGVRRAAIGRELTKLFEEFRRDTLDKLAAHYAEAGAPRGEIVIVIDRAPPKAIDARAIDAFLHDSLQRLSTKEAAAEAAEALGVSRSAAYARALALKKTS